MIAHRKLVWALLYLSIIYRKNVVCCSEASTDQLSSSPESSSTDPSGSTSLSQPTSSTTPKNPESSSTPISGSTDPSQDGSATSTNPSQVSSSDSNDQGQSKLAEHSSQLDTKGLKLFTKDDNGNKVDLDSTLYEFKLLFKGRDILLFNLKDNSKCVCVAVEDKVIWSLDNSETPIGDNNEKEYPLRVYYTPSKDSQQQQNLQATPTPSPMFVFIYFKERYLVYTVLENEWKLTLNNEIKPVEPLDESDEPVEDLFHLSISNGSDVLKELDREKYTVQTKDNLTTLTFDRHYKPVSVKIENKEVWNFDQLQNRASKPVSFTYSSDMANFVITFKNLKLTFVKDNDGNWTSSEEVIQTKRKKKVKSSKKNKNDKKKGKSPKNKGNENNDNNAAGADDANLN